MVMDGFIVVPIIIALIGFILTVPLSALALWLSTKIFKVQVTYVKALVPALIATGVGSLFGIISIVLDVSLAYGIIGVVMTGLSILVSIALYLVLPTLILKIEWKQGLLVGLVWMVFAFVAGMIISVIIGLISIFILAMVGVAMF